MNRPQQTVIPTDANSGSNSREHFDQRLGMHLLEALDSLSAVYESAAFFADVGSESVIGDYVLARGLDAVHCDRGALWLLQDGEMHLHSQQNDAVEVLAEGLPHEPRRTPRARFHNGAEARRLLRPEAPDYNVLTCPIDVASRRLGLIVVLAPADRHFVTADVKLLSAVTSQAAIALSRALQHREAELERQKLQLVVQNQSDGIVVLDRQGRTTLCNPAAREFCGTDDVLPLLQSLDPTLTLESLSHGTVERELTVPSADGQRVLCMHTRDIHSTSGDFANVIITLRDRTRQRREERLKRDFLSLISHKFRTPLTALICGIEMIQTAQGQERDQFAAELSRRTRDLSVLVDRLLYFAELLQGSWSERGSSSLPRMREDLEKHFEGQADSKPVDFVWDIAADATEVPVPGARLRVALINLIDNAVKFSQLPTPWVRIASSRTADGGIRIDVEDRGPGIPECEKEQIFAAFNQLEEEFTGAVPGAGIGLAMVREIAQRSGGRLELRDAEPKGSIFSLVYAPPEVRRK
jgi:signal transduction histidine kinase